MKNKINELKNTIQEYLNRNVSYTDLGSQYDLSSVESEKNKICNFANDTLDKALSIYEEDPNAILNGEFKDIQQSINNLPSLLDRCAKYNDAFPNQAPEASKNQRTQYTLEVNNIFENLVVKTARILSNYTARKYEKKLSTIENSDFEKGKKELETHKIELSKLINKNRSLIDEKSREKSKDSFIKRANLHKTLAIISISVAVVSIITILIVLSYTADISKIDDLSIISFLKAKFKSIIFLTFLGTLCKLSLSFFSKEWNLFVQYKHKSAVLDHQDEIMLSLNDEKPDDAATKNKLRTEIVKTIIEPPKTGYTKDFAKDFNVNPIINVAEQLTGKKV